MFYLIDFSVIRPDIGMLFWTTVIFLLVLWVLSRYAYTPIVDGLKIREDGIQDALNSAEQAKQEMANMQAENENLLQEAREERTKIIKEAKESGKKLINDARTEAKREARQLVDNAQQEIDNQKRKAIDIIKSELGVYAVDLAENIIKKQLDNHDAQVELAQKMVKDIDLN